MRAPSGRWTLTALTWNKTPMAVSAVWPRPVRGKTNDVCCAPETRTATERPTRHASSVTTPCSAAAHSLPTEKTVPAIKATIKSLIKCAQNALTVLLNLPSATVAFAPYAQLARQLPSKGQRRQISACARRGPNPHSTTAVPFVSLAQKIPGREAIAALAHLVLLLPQGGRRGALCVLQAPMLRTRCVAAHVRLAPTQTECDRPTARRVRPTASAA